jgi:hypothetical protein
MVKTDTLTGPESNLEKRLDNRLCRMTGLVTVTTGFERLGQMVSEPDRRGRGIFKHFFLSFAPFVQAALSRERVVRCFFSNHQQLACWDFVVVSV